jgi:benzodiazapine receptor
LQRFRWWHGAAFYIGVQGLMFALRSAARSYTGQTGSREQDREFYRSERLPVFAPPPAAFPIAWGINSVCAVAGGVHVLNLPRRTAGRAEFLRLQGLAWILFAAFDGAYFGLRSPVNAALVTVAYSAATAASLDVAIRRMKDPYAALSLATTVAWLLLANPVGLAQAAWNHDPFWNTGPLVEPKSEWVKTKIGD